jgi:hypothetical protein
MDMDKELNCSEGARMLIERMQTHPKDFKADGRFARITDSILGKLPVGFSDLSDRDDDALTAAYDKYILEPQLTEFVVDEIFNGDRRRAEAQQAQADKYSRSLAASMMATKNAVASSILTGTGSNDPWLMWPGGVPPQNGLQGQAVWSTPATTPISNGNITSNTASPPWFEEERKRLREMTDNTLKKLKRKSK